MGNSIMVEAARRALGPAGAFLPVPTTSAPPIDLQRDAVRRLERAGYRATWTNEAVRELREDAPRDGHTSAGRMRNASKRLVSGMIARKCRWSRVRISLVS